MIAYKKMIRHAPLIALLALPLASHAAAGSKCSNPAQRDATCIGADSERIPSTNSQAPAVLSSTLRGSNAISIPGVPVPQVQMPNTCVTAPFTSWAYDPVSYGTSLPSFVYPTAGGYLGSGGVDTPTGQCSSTADGTCGVWVPATYPYIFLGNNRGFTRCESNVVSGSVKCPVSGAAAYATSNPNAGSDFRAAIVACASNERSPGLTIQGAPMSWWSNCTDSRYCSFSLVYPSTHEGGGRDFSADAGSGSSGGDGGGE